MKKLCLYFFLIIISYSTVNSQNLVPNHSFEDYDTSYIPSIYPFFNHTFKSMYEWRTEWGFFNTPDFFFRRELYLF